MLSERDYYAGFLPAPAFGIAAALIHLCTRGPSIAWLLSTVGGFVVWTLAEYLIHRTVHHIARDQHWMHHIRPTAFVGVHTWQIVVISVMLFALLVDGLGMTLGSGAFSGIALGYTFYARTHHVIHFDPPPVGHWLRHTYDRHMVHHRGVEGNFGVSTPIWDVMFRTYVKP